MDVTDRTSAAARNSFLLWLPLLLALSAASYALAHYANAVPPAPLPGARPWFAIMAIGCLVLAVTWMTIGRSQRHRGWDGFIWLLIAPTSTLGLLIDSILLLTHFRPD